MSFRCAWCLAGGPLDIAYHDTEWGVPEHDDRKLFEGLVLEGAQAGLSWSMILRRREAYRAAFANFDAGRIARFEEVDISRILGDSGVIRNRLKIAATVTNARALLRLLEGFPSFDAYLWRFVDGQPRTNHWTTAAEVPTATAVSRSLSKDLHSRGFRFVGPTIAYAFMQAAGMVNDHVAGCFRWREVQEPGGRE